jgi:hypothetical protein
MKRSDIPDPHIEFKKYFVQCVNNYIQDPTDKKQAKLKDLVQKSIQLDDHLLFWFNAMFKWRNTRSGLTVDYKNKPSIPS